MKPEARFAQWPRPLARLALVLLIVLMVLSALALRGLPPPPPPPALPRGADVSAEVRGDGKNNDMRLYRAIAERVRQGGNYYAAAASLQRAGGYPVAPGLTVRLPTLAYATALAGPRVLAVAAMLLFAGALVALAARLGEEAGRGGASLLALGLASLGLAPLAIANLLALHEIWCGGFLILSLGLHRPQRGRWGAAWLAAAVALAIRELALPFVLLMWAYAAWHRRWREAAAWAGLVVVFAAALALHIHLAQAQLRPGDPVSPPWLVWGGLGGALHKLVYASALSVVPRWLAGPLVILCIFGWAGWKSPMGAFASLLLLGTMLGFAIAGRANNFYWGAMIAPILFTGFAFVPLSLSGLIAGAFGKQGIAPDAVPMQKA